MPCPYKQPRPRPKPLTAFRQESSVANQFDVIILGGGPAGYVAAIRSAQLGMSTAVIEQDKLGGVCVNIGCIPTKALLHSAYVAHLLREAKKAVVVATGSRVKGLPQIGLEINKTTVISSDEALFLEKAPPSMAIIGAGAVGMEFADIFHAFGTKVTLIEVLPRILPVEDAEASDVLTKSYKKRGIDVLAGAKVAKGTVTKDHVTLDVEANGAKQKVEVAVVLMAAGRAVNTENIGLKECGIQLTERGFIKVDQTLQTTAPGYFAIGDVAGPPML